MSSTNELRTTEQRRTDVLAALARNGDAWLASADPSGRPHLIAVSSWWDGERIVIATIGTSATARNLDATGLARLGIGSPDDVILVDVRREDTVPVAEAAPALSAGFANAVGWNPAEEPGDWRYFRLRPTVIQAYRGYGELEGRTVMRGSRWLS
jgi:hypothetical protein